jgi:hypothetical protein
MSPKHLLTFHIFLFFIVFVFTLVPNVFAQLQNAEKIETVDFCELIKKPDVYNGKTIRLAAVYRYGFEWSEFFCPNCSESERISTYPGKSADLTSKKIRKKLKWSYRGKTVNVIVIGKFYSTNPFDSSGHPFKIEIGYYEKADVIYNGSLALLPEKYKKRACCGLNSQP